MKGIKVVSVIICMLFSPVVFGQYSLDFSQIRNGSNSSSSANYQSEDILVLSGLEATVNSSSSYQLLNVISADTELFSIDLRTNINTNNWILYR